MFSQLYVETNEHGILWCLCLGYFYILEGIPVGEYLFLLHKTYKMHLKKSGYKYFVMFPVLMRRVVSNEPRLGAFTYFPDVVL